MARPRTAVLSLKTTKDQRHGQHHCLLFIPSIITIMKLLNKSIICTTYLLRNVLKQQLGSLHQYREQGLHQGLDLQGQDQGLQPWTKTISLTKIRPLTYLISFLPDQPVWVVAADDIHADCIYASFLFNIVLLTLYDVISQKQNLFYKCHRHHYETLCVDKTAQISRNYYSTIKLWKMVQNHNTSKIFRPKFTEINRFIND